MDAIASLSIDLFLQALGLLAAICIISITVGCILNYILHVALCLLARRRRCRQADRMFKRFDK